MANAVCIKLHIIQYYPRHHNWIKFHHH